MMEMAKVTSKGQITIPISIRRRLGINEGDKLLFISKPDGVMMVNPDMLEGDQVDAITEAAESVSAPAAAARNKEATVTPSKASAGTPPQAPGSTTPKASVIRFDESAPAVESSAVAEEVRRPIPPPGEEPEVPETRVGGVDLSTLLDDIRSIGANI